MDAWTGSCPLYDLTEVLYLRDPRTAAYVYAMVDDYQPSASLTESAEGIGFELRFLLVPAVLRRDFQFRCTKS